MFIELTEILRCPKDHDESYLICGPTEMDGRDVVRGGLVCPTCRAEYPILERIAWFAPPSPPGDANPLAPRASRLTLDAALTFLSLEGPGGYAVTLGSAGRLAPGLAGSLKGVAIAAVNPPAGTSPSAMCSVLHSPAGFPIKRRSVRAVIVGGDAARAPWLAPAVGALLPGLRAVIEDEQACPDGLAELVRGAGVLVGERRAK